MIHDIYWYTTPSRALQGVGCEICHNERVSKSKTRTHEWYINEVSQNIPNIEVLGKYISATTPILHKCKLHNIDWYATPYNILHGHGCYECLKSKIHAKNTKTQEQYDKDLKLAQPYIIRIEDYQNSFTPILHKCTIDDYKWKISPTNLLSKHSGCPKCICSIGEKEISNWLEENNISYKTQYKFENCKDIKPLPFDFYVPIYNTLIEYDGEQHYRAINSWGGEEGLKKRQKHDAIKNKYCENNNITLLRIPYFKNVKNELDNFFIC